MVFLFLKDMNGQNLVSNGSFETTANLCPGPKWLGGMGSIVPNWGGWNIAFPSQSFNTGAIVQNASPCNQSAFKNGLTAYAGSKSIVLALSYTPGGSGTYHGARAYSNLTTPLWEGCFKVGIALAGNNPSGTQTQNNVFEVVLKGSSVAERVVGTFSQNPNAGWHKFTSTFNVSSAFAGKYDRVELRHKQDPAAFFNQSAQHGIVVDDFSITSCTPIPCNANFQFNMFALTNPGSLLAGKFVGGMVLNEYHPSSTYFYDYGGGVVLSHPISKFYSPGSYTVCVTEKTADGRSCKKCLNICVPTQPDIVFNPGDLSDVPHNLKFNVAPNPADVTVNVKFTLENDANVSIKIIDKFGNLKEEVAEASYFSGDQDVPMQVGSLAADLYMVLLTIDNVTYTQQLSVVH